MATYALIPGGGGDPWEWHRLVPELATRGHHAIAVRLPAEGDGFWIPPRWSSRGLNYGTDELVTLIVRPIVVKNAFE